MSEDGPRPSIRRTASAGWLVDGVSTHKVALAGFRIFMLGYTGSASGAIAGAPAPAKAASWVEDECAWRSPRVPNRLRAVNHDDEEADGAYDGMTRAEQALLRRVRGMGGVAPGELATNGGDPYGGGNGSSSSGAAAAAAAGVGEDRKGESTSGITGMGVGDAADWVDAGGSGAGDFALSDGVTIARVADAPISHHHEAVVAHRVGMQQLAQSAAGRRLTDEAHPGAVWPADLHPGYVGAERPWVPKGNGGAYLPETSGQDDDTVWPNAWWRCERHDWNEAALEDYKEATRAIDVATDDPANGNVALASFAFFDPDQVGPMNPQASAEEFRAHYRQVHEQYARKHNLPLEISLSPMSPMLTISSPIIAQPDAKRPDEGSDAKQASVLNGRGRGQTAGHGDIPQRRPWTWRGQRIHRPSYLGYVERYTQMLPTDLQYEADARGMREFSLNQCPRVESCCLCQCCCPRGFCPSVPLAPVAHWDGQSPWETESARGCLDRLILRCASCPRSVRTGVGAAECLLPCGCCDRQTAGMTRDEIIARVGGSDGRGSRSDGRGSAVSPSMPSRARKEGKAPHTPIGQCDCVSCVWGDATTAGSAAAHPVPSATPAAATAAFEPRMPQAAVDVASLDPSAVELKERNGIVHDDARSSAPQGDVALDMPSLSTSSPSSSAGAVATAAAEGTDYSSFDHRQALVIYPRTRSRCCAQQWCCKGMSYLVMRITGPRLACCLTPETVLYGLDRSPDDEYFAFDYACAMFEVSVP